ncbi:restriction endonuclease [Bizionia sp. M204]|uniref:restriction endonuclease n=1 Tax=Bizionia sp. M204 TaxID=2675331 RepID=UPI00204F3BCA|nr:restriction endonuclease [Bizionia sp. M204]UPS90369.1 restriction endonuclease [Bizionia sp. M204]
MIDFKEIDQNGEEWELFCRDFLEYLGYYIESTVDRGPDGKKDLIVSEHLKGNLGNYKFKWLVSCKHFANRANSNSVKESDEPNILERVESFNCDGYIGFYSTVASSGLNTRLTQLKENEKIKDFRIFDYKLIENYLIRIGYSDLLMRYFPISYKQIKPLHLVTNKYIPLECKTCGIDILEEMYNNQYHANFVQIFSYANDNKTEHIHDVYWACKGRCDDIINYNLPKGKYTNWQDIGDIIIPTKYIEWILATINYIKSGRNTYEEEAFKKEKAFIVAVSQKVVREMTQEEKDRIGTLKEYGL